MRGLHPVYLVQCLFLLYSLFLCVAYSCAVVDEKDHTTGAIHNHGLKNALVSMGIRDPDSGSHHTQNEFTWEIFYVYLGRRSILFYKPISFIIVNRYRIQIWDKESHIKADPDPDHCLGRKMRIYLDWSGSCQAWKQLRSPAGRPT